MARPPLYITRADLDWPTTSPAGDANPRSGLVIHYDSTDQGLASKPLSASLDYWRRTRAFHTGPSRGWDDIGYSFLATAQGYIVEGRGLYKAQAAQPGGNTSHYSVTLATGPTDTITPEQIDAVRWLRQWLMEDHGNAGTVLGHRDFISTSCPGARAYALVEDGTFTRPPGQITEVDDMLGLREGDGIPNPSEGVKMVQRLIVQAGRGDMLGTSGVDGQWGAATSAALLQVRRDVGSGVAKADTMTGEGAAQLLVAMARHQAGRYGGGSGGGELPTEATISGTVKLKGA